MQPKDGYLDSDGEHTDSHSIAMIDQYRDVGVALCAETKSNIWHLPIFTVSLSESGFEKVYQGTTIVHQYNLKVSDKPLELKVTLVTGNEQSVRELLETLQTAVS